MHDSLYNFVPSSEVAASASAKQPKLATASSTVPGRDGTPARFHTSGAGYHTQNDGEIGGLDTPSDQEVGRVRRVVPHSICCVPMQEVTTESEGKCSDSDAISMLEYGILMCPGVRAL